jgi:serine/threonine protein kinase
MCAECSQIIHRDVKAPNVLLREVDSRWDVCISDFGTPEYCRLEPWCTAGLGSNHA